MKNKLKNFLKKAVTFGLAALTVVGTAGSAVSPVKRTTVNADEFPVCKDGDSLNLGGYELTGPNNIRNGFDSHYMYLGTDLAFCYEPNNIGTGGVAAPNHAYKAFATINNEAAGYAYLGAEHGTPRYYRAAQFLIWETLGYKIDQAYGSGTDVQNEMNTITSEYNTQINQGYTFEATYFQDAVKGSGANHSQYLLSAATRHMPFVDVDVSATIKKTSANPGITSGNPNYSLAGATFRVDVTGPNDGNGNPTSFSTTVTTGDNGSVTFNHTFPQMPEGTTASDFTITVTEIGAPQGYNLPDATNASQTQKTANPTFTFSDKAKNDPVVIQVTKRAQDGTVVSNPKPLENAEFKLNFYAVDPTTADVSNLTPTRTWYLTTHKYENNYFAALNDAENDSRSSELYKNSVGDAILPIGILTIQETSAPSGYQIAENTFIDVNGQGITKDANGIVTMRITPNSSSSGGASINFGHEIIVSDKSVRGGFKITKFDEDLNKADTQGDATSLKAKFQVINNNNYDVLSIDENGIQRGAKPGEAVYEFETADDGSFVSNNNLLPSGNYTIKEIEAPTGYTLNGTTEAALTISDTVPGETHDFNGTIQDKIILGGFKFQKKDAQTGLNTPEGNATLGNAEYDVYNSSAKAVMVKGSLYQPNEKVYSFTTDADGSFTSPTDLLPYGTYTVYETKAPDGYNLDATAAAGVQFQIRNNQELVNVEADNTVQRGSFTMAKRDYIDKSVNPEGDASLIGGTYNVINNSTNAVLVDKNQDGVLDKNTELFAPGEVVFTFTTTTENTKNGIYTSPKELLPYGSYTIEEAQAPEGYQLITDNGAAISFDFDVTA